MPQYKSVRFTIGLLGSIGLGFTAGFIVDDNPADGRELSVEVTISPEFVQAEYSKNATHAQVVDGHLKALNNLTFAVEARAKKGLAPDSLRSLSADDFHGSVVRGESGSSGITFLDRPGVIELTKEDLLHHLSVLTSTHEFQSISVAEVTVSSIPARFIAPWQIALIFSAAGGFIYTLTFLLYQGLRSYWNNDHQKN